MTCEKCEQDPCNCIASSSKGPKRTWLLQTCSEPGCTVLIRTLPGEQDPGPTCKWHRGGTAYNSDQIHTRPNEGPLISLDEFGRDLFDAIAIQARIRTAFKTAARYQDHGQCGQAERLEREAVDLQKQLEAILKKNTIAPDDLRRLLAIQ